MRPLGGLYFDQGSLTVLFGFNVSSVTDLATGRFRINWSAGVSTSAVVTFGGDLPDIREVGRTGTTLTVETRDASGTLADGLTSVGVWG